MSVTAVVTALTSIVAINLLSGEHKTEREISSLSAVDDPEFSRAASVLFGSPLVAGNEVTPLYNGRQIFGAMLDEIRQAKKSITFETYIYWSGDVGAAFTQALVERAHAGVKIHLIIDAVGSAKMDATQLRAMTEAGAEIEKYRAVRWYNLDRINNRTHRKLLIVDGRIGFTGGVGIADKWDGDADGPDHWRDTHFRVVGPVVAQMQATFAEHWRATRGALLQGDAYFPPLSKAGEMPAQIVSSAENDGTERIRLMYLLSIAAARRSILLANSYFVPDDLSVRTLIAARRRGVDVQIIVPGPQIDSEVTRAASRRKWGPLLEAGIAISEFQPTMFHCKVMVVDDLWVSVGSTNFDNRSFRLNAEANLNVIDRGLALQERRAFEKDRLRSRHITLEEWHHRPLLDRIGDWFAGLVGSQL
ncbi:MAG TPA: phospholipase D-like domain-containing protein [Polyangia bacterium]|nr:phospholipase D-like domain-containing protein [Polyangia bacterium]